MSPEELDKVLQSHQLWRHSRGVEGERADFEDAELQGADFRDANLERAEFKNADLIRTNLQGAQLFEASFEGAKLQGADFRNAFLRQATFKKADLTEANLQDARIAGASFYGATLAKADLRNAFLEGAEFKNANLEETNLQGAYLLRASFEGAELTGANLRNAFLEEAEFKNAGLTETSFEGARFTAAGFENAKLMGTNLRNASLDRAEFKNSDLTDANLRGAELRRASFDGAILRGTNLREADLQNANLENASFLLTSQLAGADVAGAKLPSAIAEFKGLETIAEATSNAQKLFIAMLGGCLYSWLTIGTTKDAGLITNSASSPLPIIGTALPIVGFYSVAPIVLLAIYFYFHLNMQRLWEALADLPAVFPDGRSLDKRADPWLLNGLVSAHFVRLSRERPSLSRVQQWLSILLAWWVVPVTLFVFWGRFLVRHDWLGTDLHIVLLASAISFGWMSYRLARTTLGGASRRPFFWTQAWKDMRTFKRTLGIVATSVLAVVLYLISWSAIEGIPNPGDVYSEYSEYGLQRLVPSLLEKIHFSPFANLVEEDVSTKPASWTGQPNEYVLVKGAHLYKADMRFAKASGAFFANADLRGANLSRTDLSDADLTNADLTEADLSDAYLLGADLSKAKLQGAHLSNANVSDCDLSNANLSNADLSNADILNADVSRAQLASANLSKATLTYADLSNADLSNANLSNAFLEYTNLSNANLAFAHLSNARLSGNLSNANLDHAELQGAHLGLVTGLTRSQLANAKTDDETILPPFLTP